MASPDCFSEFISEDTSSDSRLSSNTSLLIPPKCQAQSFLRILLFLLPLPELVPNRKELLLKYLLNYGEGKLGQRWPLPSLSIPSLLPRIFLTPLNLLLHPEICYCVFVLKPFHFVPLRSFCDWNCFQATSNRNHNSDFNK